MKNVTITLPDDVAREVRVKAAKAGLSVSAWFRELAEGKIASASGNAGESEDAKAAAWDRLLNGPTFDLGLNGQMPSRDERNARR